MGDYILTVDFKVCPFDGSPCNRYLADSAGNVAYSDCFVKGSDGKLLYVCVRVRFKGANSTVDRGMGMTVYEKLKRQGLIPK